MRFGVADARVEVPQAIVARERFDGNGARVPWLTRSGRRQGHKHQCRYAAKKFAAVVPDARCRSFYGNNRSCGAA
jgi:hypothetical protein